MGRGQNTNINRSSEEADFTLMNDVEGSSSVDDVTSDGVEIARKPELAVEPEDGTEFL